METHSLPILFAVLTIALIVFAGAHAQEASPELIARGRELFNKKEGLSVKYACILCHQKDKVIRRSKLQPLGDKLPDVINKYIVEKSKGKPLAKDSQEMKALEAYILHEHSK